MYRKWENLRKSCSVFHRGAFKRTKYWQLISKCTPKKEETCFSIIQIMCIPLEQFQTDRIKSMHRIFWTLNLNPVSLIFVNQILNSRLFICLDCIIYEPRIWFKWFLSRSAFYVLCFIVMFSVDYTYVLINQQCGLLYYSIVDRHSSLLSM